VHLVLAHPSRGDAVEGVVVLSSRWRRYSRYRYMQLRRVRWSIVKRLSTAKSQFRIMVPLRLATLVFLSALQTASADMDVEVKGGLLTVRARAVPLAQLLDRLSVETGMKLTYDGRRPSQLMTINIEHLSEAEAVGRIFEGLGINYALQTDASGRRVERLIIADAVGSVPLAPASTTLPPRQAIAGQAQESAPLEESAPPEEDQSSNIQATSELPMSGGVERERPPAPIPTPLGPAFSSPGMTPGFPAFSSPGMVPGFPNPASNPFPFRPPFPGDASNPLLR
jgi:hypothetical protein